MERITERDGLLVRSKFKGEYGSQTILHALADYEDAEEQGLLVRIGEKEPFPKEIEQILKNQIVIMGMLQEIKFAYLDEDDIPDELRNIQDTYEVLKNNKKLKEMESD